MADGSMRDFEKYSRPLLAARMPVSVQTAFSLPGIWYLWIPHGETLRRKGLVSDKGRASPLLYLRSVRMSADYAVDNRIVEIPPNPQMQRKSIPQPMSYSSETVLCT